MSLPPATTCNLKVKAGCKGNRLNHYILDRPKFVIFWYNPEICRIYTYYTSNKCKDCLEVLDILKDRSPLVPIWVNLTKIENDKITVLDIFKFCHDSAKDPLFYSSQKL